MTRPIRLKLYAYNVGFGDCFLLQFQYADTSMQHVLIDFGTTKLPTSGPRTIADVAKKIAEHCGGKLDMVVVTHRHADHMSGFDGTSGKIIAGLDPELVVQPWTEDPDIDPDATAPAGSSQRGHALAARRRAAAVSLRDMHTVASRVRTRAAHLQQAVTRPRRSCPVAADEIHFVGETNIRNPGAVREPDEDGQGAACTRASARACRSPSVLPGVKVTVLGPPTLEQAPGIASMREQGRNGVLAPRGRHVAAGRLGRDRAVVPATPRRSTSRRSPSGSCPQIDRMSAEELLAIVRSVDDALNNTSLILLFDIGGTKLLFPGDAQIENWRYALFEAPNSQEIRRSCWRHGALQGRPPRQPERNAEDALERLRPAQAAREARPAPDSHLHTRRQARQGQPRHRGAAQQADGCPRSGVGAGEHPDPAQQEGVLARGRDPVPALVARGALLPGVSLR